MADDDLGLVPAGRRAANDDLGLIPAGSSSPAGQPDVVQKALNYHTGNNWIDAPMGVLQGVGKGVMSTTLGVGHILSNVTGQPLVIGNHAITPQDEELLTKANGIGQGTGKFLEQGAEYAIPAAAVSKTLKGTSLLARMAGQAGIGAGVSAAQSGGNPTDIAIGGLMGAGGEAAGAAIKGIKSLAGARQPTLDNYSTAFSAVPTQKKVLSKIMPTLTRDGIMPEKGPVEMQASVKDKLSQLGDKYNALPADIPTREMTPDSIINGLEQQQNALKRGSVVSNANQPFFDKLQKEIEDVKSLAGQNGGNINFADLKYLRDGANGRTNFLSPDIDKELYRGVGNVYRGGMDSLAPETTQLNRDWAHYNMADDVLSHNLSMGRGTTKSGLSKALAKVGASETGAASGFALGHAIAGPVGGAVGAVAGSVLYPKLAGPIADAAKNFLESPQFKKLPAMSQNAFKFAATNGDVASVAKFMGQRAPVTTIQLLTGNNQQSQ